MELLVVAAVFFGLALLAALPLIALLAVSESWTPRRADSPHNS